MACNSFKRFESSTEPTLTFDARLVNKPSLWDHIALEATLIRDIRDIIPQIQYIFAIAVTHLN